MYPLLGSSGSVVGRGRRRRCRVHGRPRRRGVWLVTYEDAAAYGAKGGGVEVEGAIGGFPSGEEGSDGGLEEKVQGEFGVQEEFFP